MNMRFNVRATHNGVDRHFAQFITREHAERYIATLSAYTVDVSYYIIEVEAGSAWPGSVVCGEEY